MTQPNIVSEIIDPADLLVGLPKWACPLKSIVENGQCARCERCKLSPKITWCRNGCGITY